MSLDLVAFSSALRLQFLLGSWGARERDGQVGLGQQRAAVENFGLWSRFGRTDWAGSSDGVIGLKSHGWWGGVQVGSRGTDSESSA